ncbi:flagellar motor switch protein FliN [Aquipuribacter nitratireducens]|uniref:Flagellar motor switch protein FliN n=1 Tax=Aquipuribacter nitratireducens TaxID=650104 RepID=A0ABW0GTI2_9MICO
MTSLSSSTPGTGTTASTHAEAAAATAGAAACALLPLEPGSVPVPVAVSTVPGVPTTAVPADHVAVTARWTGAGDGLVALLLSPDALLALSGGESPDAAALVPALEAAASALGPCVLGPAETTSAPGLLEQLLAEGADAALVRLGADGDPAATVHLAVVARATAPTTAHVPGQRTPAGAGAGAATRSATGRGIEMLRGVHMEVTAEIGRTRMTVQELLELAAGSVVELDRPIGSPADLLVNGRLFARGEVVVVDEEFALRITEIVEPDDDVHRTA